MIEPTEGWIGYISKIFTMIGVVFALILSVLNWKYTVEKSINNMQTLYDQRFLKTSEDIQEIKEQFNNQIVRLDSISNTVNDMRIIMKSKEKQA